MQVARSSNFFHPLPHIESIKMLADKGLDGIELICEYPDDILYFMQPHNFSTLLSLKDDYGLQYYIHAPWGDTNAASLNEGIRRASVDDWKRSIDFAHSLGSRLVTVHIGHRSTLESREAV
ncbi:MAG: sugar phosphate isomerase/epimerase, partial [Firmicutes bacterium]|nr:sugar phosphate isomerase/epimerase [Bacillota bacterium]